MPQIDWNDYACEGLYDELLAAPGTPRPAAKSLSEYLGSLAPKEVRDLKTAAEGAIVHGLMAIFSELSRVNAVEA